MLILIACIGSTSLSPPEITLPSPYYPVDQAIPSLNYGQNGSTSFYVATNQTAATKFGNYSITNNNHMFSHTDWTMTQTNVTVWDLVPQASEWVVQDVNNQPGYFVFAQNDYSPTPIKPQELAQELIFDYNQTIDWILVKYGITTKSLVNQQTTVRNITIEIREDDNGLPKKDSFLKSINFSNGILDNGFKVDEYELDQNIVDYNVNLTVNFEVESGKKYWLIFNASKSYSLSFRNYFTMYYDSNSQLNTLNRSLSTGDFEECWKSSDRSGSSQFWQQNGSYHPYLKIGYTITQPLLPSDIGLNLTIGNSKVSITDDGRGLITNLTTWESTTYQFNATENVKFNVSIDGVLQNQSPVKIDATYAVTTQTAWMMMYNIPVFNIGTLQHRNISVDLGGQFNNVQINRTATVVGKTIMIPAIGSGSVSSQITAISPNAIVSITAPQRVHRGDILAINVLHDGSVGYSEFRADLWCDGIKINDITLGKSYNQNVSLYTIPSTAPIGQYVIAVRTYRYASVEVTNPMYVANIENKIAGYQTMIVEVYDTTDVSLIIKDNLNRAIPNLAVNATGPVNYTDIRTNTIGAFVVEGMEYGNYTLSWIVDDQVIRSNITIPTSGTTIFMPYRYYFMVDTVISVVDVNTKAYTTDVRINRITKTTDSAGQVTFTLREGDYVVEILSNDSVIETQNISVIKGSQQFTVQTSIDAYPAVFQMPIWSWYIIGILGTSILGLIYWYKAVRPKIDADKAELYASREDRAKLLLDTISLRAVIIVASNSNQAVASRLYQTDDRFNEDLVTGFLGAIGEWEGEVEHDTSQIGGLRQIQYKSFTVSAEYSDNFKMFIISSEPILSKQMKGRLDTLVYTIKHQYGTLLKNFNGLTEPFKKLKTIIDETLQVTEMQSIYHMQESIDMHLVPKVLQNFVIRLKTGHYKQTKLSILLQYMLDQKIADQKVEACILLNLLLDANVFESANKVDFI